MGKFLISKLRFLQLPNLQKETLKNKQTILQQNVFWSETRQYTTYRSCILVRLLVESQGALEAKETASSLPEWIDDEGADEQANSDAGGDLNHLCSNVKDNSIIAIAFAVWHR